MTVNFESALQDGDAEGVITGLAPLAESERRRLAPQAAQWLKELKANAISRATKPWPYRLDSQTLLRAARAMVVGTASLSELRKLGNWSTPDEDVALRVMADRRPDWLAEWAAFVLENETTSWHTPFLLVRRLITEGLLPRPATSWYPLSMIYGLQRRDRELYQALKADRGLLEDEVWRLFEVEGGGDTSLAAHDKYSADRNSWSWALLQLSGEGLLSRDRLLDASLAALQRDFAPFRAGWFSRFHESLQPTQAERLARKERYLGLVASAVPATASFAVKALRQAGPLSLEDVGQLAPALASSATGVVRDAVRLLPSSVRSAELAAEHLPHRSADIQSALLGLVEKHASQPSVRERLERARASVAPSLAARVATLLSLDAMAARTSQVRAEERAAPPPRRESSTSVPGPIDGIADLVELLAALLEEIQDPHDIERALDGVSRLCERTPDVVRRLEPIVKRAGKLLGDRAPARFDGHSPRSDIAGLIIAWATGTPPAAAETPHPLPRWLTGRSARPDPHQKSVLAFLSGRVREVAARAARGEAAPLLSLPTGRGGALEVDEFEARQRRLANAGRRPDPFDAIQARLRADGSDEGERYRFVYGATGEKHISFQLRVEPAMKVEPELTDVPALFYAAVDPAGPDYGGVAASGSTGLAEAIRWVGTVWPSNREPYYAKGALELGGNIDWWAARWELRCFLEPMLIPNEPLGEMATLLLSLGLGAKESGERGLATDVTIAAVAEGRLDVEKAGKTIGGLYNSKLLKGSRLATSLGDASRISQTHAESVSDLIEIALSGLYGPPPSDLHAPLALLNELSAARGHGVKRPTAKAYLTGIEGSGKTAALAKQLLAR